MHQFLAHLIPQIEHFGMFGYWFILIVSFLESLAFFGLLMPGTFIVVPMGFMASQGYFDIGDLMFFAILGAILGDGFSFFLGKKGDSFIRKYPKLEKLALRGEKFVGDHGGKSVFLARFVGPVRPIVPFAAGLLRMQTKKFFIWNIFSSTIWGISYLSIGYFFGTAWRRIEKTTSRVAFLLFLGILIAAFVYNHRQRIIKEIKEGYVLLKSIF